MPTTNPAFDSYTTGKAVVSQFAERVKDKIILVTGANPNGIGLSTTTSLATASPRLLILAGRNEARLSESIAIVKQENPTVQCKALKLDLSSQKSCRDAAQEVLEDPSIPHIDLLINNAGVMDIEERTLSPEGIEMQFATNHIGHFLFTTLLYPKLVAAAKLSHPGDVRVINLSSRAVVYNAVRFSDWNFTKPESELPPSEHLSKPVRDLWNRHEDLPYVPQAAYGQSKTANVLFSVELNNRWLEKDGILSTSVHPGQVSTDLSRHMDKEVLRGAMLTFMKSNPQHHLKNLDEGCSTTLVAALDPSLTRSDIYMADCQVTAAPEYATDHDKALKLWELSERLVESTK